MTEPSQSSVSRVLAMQTACLTALMGFFAFNVVVYSPVFFNTPVICPFVESNCNPAGRCLTENSIGR